MKTSELTGAALDWAVAKCEYPEQPINTTLGFPYLGFGRFNPSANWAQGGPLIEREEISIAKVGRSAEDAMAPHPECWASHIDGVFCRYGPTPLISAMRCYVASKLGDNIDIPEELTP